MRKHGVVVFGTAVEQGHHAVKLRLRDVDRVDLVGVEGLVDLLAPQLTVHKDTALGVTVEHPEQVPVVAVHEVGEILVAGDEDALHVAFDLVDQLVGVDLAVLVLKDVALEGREDLLLSLLAEVLAHDLGELGPQRAVENRVLGHVLVGGEGVVAQGDVLARVDRAVVGGRAVTVVRALGALGVLVAAVAVVVDRLVKLGVLLRALVLVAPFVVLLERDVGADLLGHLFELGAPGELRHVALDGSLELVGHLVVAPEVLEVELKAVLVAGEDHEGVAVRDGRAVRVQGRDAEVAHDLVGGGAGGVGRGCRAKRHAGGQRGDSGRLKPPFELFEQLHETFFL